MDYHQDILKIIVRVCTNHSIVFEISKSKTVFCFRLSTHLIEKVFQRPISNIHMDADNLSISELRLVKGYVYGTHSVTISYDFLCSDINSLCTTVNMYSYTFRFRLINCISRPKMYWWNSKTHHNSSVIYSLYDHILPFILINPSLTYRVIKLSAQDLSWDSQHTMYWILRCPFRTVVVVYTLERCSGNVWAWSTFTFQVPFQFIYTGSKISHHCISKFSHNYRCIFIRVLRLKLLVARCETQDNKRRLGIHKSS